MTAGPWPVIVTASIDCGVGTIRIGERYMVHDCIWALAWPGPRKSWQELPGQEILCIGCLKPGAVGVGVDGGMVEEGLGRDGVGAI